MVRKRTKKTGGKVQRRTKQPVVIVRTHQDREREFKKAERLGRLHEALTSLMVSDVNQRDQKRQLDRLTALYGTDDVKWMIQVVIDDLNQLRETHGFQEGAKRRH